VLTQSVDENCLYKEQEFGDIQISFRTVGLENVADHNEIYQAIESDFCNASSFGIGIIL
jgi:hypothetical protein